MHGDTDDIIDDITLHITYSIAYDITHHGILYNIRNITYTLTHK